MIWRRWLVSAAALVLMPTLVPAGRVGQASPLAQAETPTPASTATPNKPILLTDPLPDPHQDGVLYFPETGHTLRGKFLAHWQQNGGLAQFGYPLTEEFFEPDGPNNSLLQVQYFERNRFELHPEYQPPYDVLLGTLGRAFHQQDPPAAPLPAPAVYFPETGHNLSDVFLQYWQTHGGLAVNGYPITEPQMETSSDGRQYLTQWFERSRFELHPENAGSPYEVLLGTLGRQLSEKRGYPYGWYPASGYAVDYSWIAGYVRLYAPGGCMAPWCGCSIFQYTDAGLRVQLNQPDGSQYFVRRGLRDREPSVAFGRPAGSGEPIYGCPADGAPGYYANAMQGNPAR